MMMKIFWCKDVWSESGKKFLCKEKTHYEHAGILKA